MRKTISTKLFGDLLKKYGYTFYAGVPCSFLKNLINYANNECTYIMATNEGDAVATCAGSHVAGKKSVLLIQNSGLTNALSPLTSLLHPFKIPILGFVSWRGEPNIKDEPQHELMGQITKSLLNNAQIKSEVLAEQMDEIESQLIRAEEEMSKGNSFFFIIKKGTFDNVDIIKIPPLNNKKTKPSPDLTSKQSNLKRVDVLQLIHNNRYNNTVFIATTGYTGRELSQVKDDIRNLYMVGSMGCLSSFVLGITLQKPQHNIVAIDGDGALLMRLGSMATTAFYKPKNMLHIVLDNNLYESTGSQTTVSENINFTDLAHSIQYPQVKTATTKEEIINIFLQWQEKPQLTFLHIKIKPGVMDNLERPKRTPLQVKQQLMNYLAEIL